MPSLRSFAERCVVCLVSGYLAFGPNFVSKIRRRTDHFKICTAFNLMCPACDQDLIVGNARFAPDDDRREFCNWLEVLEIFMLKHRDIF